MRFVASTYRFTLACDKEYDYEILGSEREEIQRIHEQLQTQLHGWDFEDLPLTSNAPVTRRTRASVPSDHKFQVEDS